MNDALSLRLKNAPKKPGVYIYRNIDNNIIYIGKAKNLFKRVNSYFQKKQSDFKTKQLVEKIASVEFLVTDNDVEALILELNLIKKHKPVFNIECKDDKSYPYISLTVNDNFPRIAITREAHKKGVKYFGPYVNAKAMRQTLDILRSIFPLRTCKGHVPGRKTHKQINRKAGYTPCLNFHISKCLAPCRNKISVEDYQKIVRDVLDFLSGDKSKAITSLKKRMTSEANSRHFEQAARIRDRIKAVEAIQHKQKMTSEQGDDLDIFGTSSRNGYFSSAIFMVRGGKLIGSKNIEFKENAETEPLLAFIKQHYYSTSFVPKEVILSQDISDVLTLENWLSGIKKTPVSIKKPQRGRKKRLAELASKNAYYNLDFYLKKMQSDSKKSMEALNKLKRDLNIEMPCRIECFDVSNIAGTNAVGSMVVFENGRPKKAHYRKFKIRFSQGINDCKMLSEIIERRMKNIAKTNDESFKIKPDLIIVDGGKGQLLAAKKVLDKYFKNNSINKETPAIAALAKKEEELFIPLRKDSIKLAKDSAAYKLIQRIRNEAHRFAIEYHRLLRTKNMLGFKTNKS